MKHPPLRRRLIFWAVAAVAVLVAVLLVLVGVGVLRIGGSSSAATLTVTRVHWTILQGTINGSSSTGWFGPNSFNYTGSDGYPLQTAAGAPFTLAVVLSVLGGHSHTIYSILASAPFSVASCRPGLPVVVPVDDDAGFDFTIQTPSSPGASLALNITLNALDSTSGACPAT